MNRHFPPAELDRLDTSFSAMSPSMLDGYLAAVASGPNFAMPDQILQWVSDTVASEAPLDFKIGMPEQTITNLIIQHYQAVNDALNDQTYVPRMTDPQAWCRGYQGGFAYDMMAWAPLLAAQPELLKVIMWSAEGQPLDNTQATLADLARRIHAFWVSQRRNGSNPDGLLGQLAALARTDAQLPNRRLR